MSKRTPADEKTLREELRKVETLWPQIDALCSDGDAADQRHQRRDQAPQAVRDLLEEFDRANMHAMHVLSFTATGIKRARETPDYKSSFGPVPTINEGATIGLRIFVLHACAELERFLRALATLRVDPAELARIRKDEQQSPAFPSLDKSDHKIAIEQLIDAMQPSYGAPGVFFQKVDRVFGVNIAPPVSQVLEALIRWRHEFSHRNNPMPEIDWLDNTNGDPDFEVLIHWLVALRLLGEHVALG